MIDRALFSIALLLPLAGSALCQELAPSPSQSPEQASESLQETFRKLSSPGAALALPSYAEVQKEKQREEFAPGTDRRSDAGTSALPLSNRTGAEYLYQGAPRHIIRRAEGYFFHADGGRVDVGAGYADIRDRDGNAYWNHEIPKYGVVRWTFGKTGPRETRRFAPSGNYTEQELSPKMLVSPHEVTADNTRRALRDAAGR